MTNSFNKFLQEWCKRNYKKDKINHCLLYKQFKKDYNKWFKKHEIIKNNKEV